MSLLEANTLLTRPESRALYETLASRSADEKHRSYWKWFLAVSEHPRPSMHCAPFVDWLSGVVSAIGLPTSRDAADNFCVHVPGTRAGPAVILQAHIDMVEAVDKGKAFDFATCPIDVVLKGDVLAADGTTLGADDGAGLACLLVMMELRETFQHPPLELLFTTDEEPGLFGAMALRDGELIPSAKYLINVDSEDWGEVVIGCAGCAQRLITLPVTREEATGAVVEVTVDNFVGGHTAAAIDQFRGNALQWVEELLLRVPDPSLRLVEINGGHADNAIPVHCTATALVADGAKFV